MTTSRAGLPRFLAYAAASGRMVMTGMDARQILNHIRDHMWPAVDDRSVEILDCGPGGVSAEVAALSIEDARKRFFTVYRGADVFGLPPIVLTPAPCRSPPI